MSGRHSSYFSPKHEIEDSGDLEEDDEMSEQSDGN